MGTTPGGSEIVSPQSSLPQIGNVNHNTNWTLNLPYGTYYWSVQAVDTAFGRSSFAPEATLIVPPPTYDFGNITYTTPEGNITATPNVVEIVRTGDTTVAEDVTVTAISGTATAGNDYTTALFTVSFVANEPSAFVPIEILGDLGVEPDETLDLQITGFSGSGVVGTQGTTTLTLTNDDTSYQFSAASYTTPEGNTTTTPNLVEIVRTGDTTVAEDVTVTAISGTATAGSDYKAGPFLVSFIPSQTNAFVSLEILGDLIDESDENIDLQITGFSGDGVLGTLTNATLSLTDDDTTGVSITQTGSSTDIAEGGLSDTYNIVLNSVPTAPVTITATPSNPEVDLGLGAGVPLNLSFAADTTALTPQTVNITATNDNIAEGNHSSIITHSLSSSDPNYNAPNTPFTVDGIAGNTVTANITDNDSIGINLTTTDTLTSEAGDTGNFSIALTSQPTSDVLITLNSSNPNEASLSTPSVTFTAQNWSSPQLVTITGVDDNIRDGDISYSIISSIDPSSDSKYTTLPPDTLDFINQDNDSIGINLTTSDTLTSEAGDTGNFSIVLNSQPTSDVLITLSNSNPQEGSLLTPSVTFNSQNWSTPQVVTVTGVDDNIQDGDIGYSIISSVDPSSDSKYTTLPPDTLDFINQDNDSIGINLTTSDTLTSEAGDTGNFSIVLNSQPTSDVLITLSNSNPQEGSLLTPSVTFNSQNWSTPQVVTVTGVDDNIQDGDIGYSIISSVDPSSDSKYTTLPPDTLDFINQDNDSIGINLTTSDTLTSEAGDTGNFNLVLTSQPTSDVLITLNRHLRKSPNALYRYFWNL
uniref:Cadherin domain-containing protein n=1 Tax=Planktothrix pseudagardhii TaxID=132604 RepID=A0A9W4G241_9CYAN|nr:hypothetical protein NO713_00002 [Planktothrix pseudagardhii]